MSELFIADLHLDASRPIPTAVFIDFLRTEANAANKLYILGDLFEACTGNDELDADQQRIAAELAAISDAGTQCFFMHGNRDFLIGPRFLAASKLQLLPDPTLIYVGGQSVLISHGDVYCTDDVGYQRYRKVVRNPLVRAFYDSLPRAVRIRIVSSLRSNSQNNTQQKVAAIMDVNSHAIEAAFRDYQPAVLLHGHTHRPGTHALQVDGQDYQRIVLGDWYEQGSVLRWDANGPRLEQLSY
jgi:UDP-2,3-diacylglucosamine hydrolase